LAAGRTLAWPHGRWATSPDRRWPQPWEQRRASWPGMASPVALEEATTKGRQHDPWSRAATPTSRWLLPWVQCRAGGTAWPGWPAAGMLEEATSKGRQLALLSQLHRAHVVGAAPHCLTGYLPSSPHPR